VSRYGHAVFSSFSSLASGAAFRVFSRSPFFEAQNLFFACPRLSLLSFFPSVLLASGTRFFSWFARACSFAALSFWKGFLRCPFLSPKATIPSLSFTHDRAKLLTVLDLFLLEEDQELHPAAARIPEPFFPLFLFCGLGDVGGPSRCAPSIIDAGERDDSWVS